MKPAIVNLGLVFLLSSVFEMFIDLDSQVLTSWTLFHQKENCVPVYWERAVSQI